MRNLLFTVIRLFTLNYYFQRKQKNRLLIFMFHQVNDCKNSFYPAMSVLTFRKLIEFIKSNYEVINMSEIKSYFKKTDKSAAIISFDDAHYDIITNVLPILSELNIPFNINVDTEVLETRKPQDFVRVYDIINHTQIESYFNAKFMKKPIIINRSTPIYTENEFTTLLSDLSTKEKREITEDLAEKAGMKEENYSRMLSKEDIVNLSKQNVEFGSHSHTHSILTEMPEELIHHELSLSKEILEDLTKKKIDVLAYPNGVYNALVEKIAKNIGYSIMLQTDDQINTMNANEINIESYKRINQYHQNLNEALAHSYGVIKKLKKILK